MIDGMKILDVRSLRDCSADVMADAARGVPRIMPADFYRSMSVDERALLGARNAMYSFPTVELVQWIKDEIGERSAIEIGAGHGALAAALDIRATDNCMQAEPAIAASYLASGQKPIIYGENVERLSAKDAVAIFKPQVVVACWVTHLFREDRRAAGGNVFGVGVDEEALIDACETYIFIGNEQVHRNKSIWDRPHRIIYPEWLYSRAHNGTKEFIAVWGK